MSEQAARRSRAHGRAFLAELGVHLLVLLAVVFALYPVLWVVALALSPGDAPEPRVLPFVSSPSLEHFAAVLGVGAGSEAGGGWLFGRQLLNSVLVSASTAIVAVALATPAAYALARFDFVGAKEGERALLATQMFPGVAASIPLYLILNALSLLDTRTGLILVYATTAVPFAIFQLRGAFAAIPRDLEEAAMVDGATRFGAFLRVVLPVVLQRYVGEYDARWGRFAAGAILVSLPVMGLFYALQRNLVRGLSAGGVKG